MPLFFYIVLINLLVRLGAAVARKRREPKPALLCASCSFAHMQYAVSGKRTISCTFGGAVRPILIDVMYCTDYRDRSAPVRVPVVGFVRELSDVEIVAEPESAGHSMPRGISNFNGTCPTIFDAIGFLKPRVAFS